MAPLSLPEGLSLGSFGIALRRFLVPRPVFVCVSNERLGFYWAASGSLLYRVVSLPDGVVREGTPVARDAVADLIADLILECDLVGAELIVCLPLSAAGWCVVDGLAAHDLSAARARLASCELPFNLSDSYISLSELGGSVEAVAVPRLLTQAWIEVVDSADLPLRRVDWLLSAAQRGLMQLTNDWEGDLVWLLIDQGSGRLVLHRGGVPEVDHSFSADDVDGSQQLIRQLIGAWQGLLDEPQPLGWWLSISDDLSPHWCSIVEGTAGEQNLTQRLTWSPELWDGDGFSEALSPLEHLALFALHQEEQ